MKLKEEHSSLEAERRVLGSILINPDAITLVDSLLTADDFYYRPCRIIYQSMVEVHTTLKMINELVLVDHLKKTDDLEAVGGEGFIISLSEDFTMIGQLDGLCAIIKDKSKKRQLLKTAIALAESTYKKDESIEVMLDQAEKDILTLSRNRGEVGFLQLGICVKSAFADINSKAAGHVGISSGFPVLDTLTGGFQKSELIILAARPSMGKTALGVSFALNAAKLGKQVGIFSIEMSKESLALRLLALESGVEMSRIKSGQIITDAGQKWLEFASAAERLSKLPIHIDDSVQLISEIRSRARKLSAEKKLDMLVIDYLGLVDTLKNHSSKVLEIAEISRALKLLSKELNVPVICLSQLSRKPEERQDARPKLSDLRDSGAIEQDADIIMFLYRDNYYNKEADINKTEVIIGKNRNGPTGTILLRFEPNTMAFDSYEPVPGKPHWNMDN